MADVIKERLNVDMTPAFTGLNDWLPTSAEKNSSFFGLERRNLTLGELRPNMLIHRRRKRSFSECAGGVNG